MTGTAWALAALLVGAAGLCLWAALTGSSDVDWRHETTRQWLGTHTRRMRQQDTQPLAQPSAGWLPPRERPGGEAQRLPSHEDVLRARERSPEL
jgi:hypothetical protein